MFINLRVMLNGKLKLGFMENLYVESWDELFVNEFLQFQEFILHEQSHAGGIQEMVFFKREERLLRGGMAPNFQQSTVFTLKLL